MTTVPIVTKRESAPFFRFDLSKINIVTVSDDTDARFGDSCDSEVAVTGGMSDIILSKDWQVAYIIIDNDAMARDREAYII